MFPPRPVSLLYALLLASRLSSTMITLNANLVHLRDTTILNQIARTGAAIGSILSKESRDLVDRSKSLLEYYEKYTRQTFSSNRIEVWIWRLNEAAPRNFPSPLFSFNFPSEWRAEDWKTRGNTFKGKWRPVEIRRRSVSFAGGIISHYRRRLLRTI